MKAKSVGLVALACWVTVSLTACGTSHAIKPLSLRNAPGVFKDVFHPHGLAPKEVKAAFAKQGIRLREMRTQHSHVVVLFDPRRHAPTKAGLRYGAPAQPYIWVFLHSTNNNSVSVGNVYVSDGPSEDERSINAALDTLYRSYKH